MRIFYDIFTFDDSGLLLDLIGLLFSSEITKVLSSSLIEDIKTAPKTKSYMSHVTRPKKRMVFDMISITTIFNMKRAIFSFVFHFAVQFD